MKPMRDLDDQLEQWMQEGPHVLPDQALDEAMRRVGRTRQRPLVLVHDRMATAGRTRRVVWISAAVAAAAAVLLAAVLFSVGNSQNIGEEEPAPTAVASPTPRPSLPPPSNVEPNAIVPIPGEPTGSMQIAASEDQVWVSSDQQIVAIDPATGATDTIPVPIADGSWGGLLFAEGSLWAADFGEGRIYRIDPASREILADIAVGAEPVALTPVPGGIWFSTTTSSGWDVRRIDTATNTIAATVEGGNEVSYGHGSLWINQRGTTRLLRADPVSGETTAVIEVPVGDNCATKHVADSVWISCFFTQPAQSLTRIDPEANAVLTTVRLNGLPAGRFFGLDGRMWIPTLALPEGGGFEAIDLETNTVERWLLVGNEFDPNDPVIVGDSLWVPNDGGGEVYRFALEALGAP